MARVLAAVVLAAKEHAQLRSRCIVYAVCARNYSVWFSINCVFANIQWENRCGVLEPCVCLRQAVKASSLSLLLNKRVDRGVACCHKKVWHLIWRQALGTTGPDDHYVAGIYFCM